MLPAARDHYKRTLRRYHALNMMLARAWSGVDRDLEGSWRRIGPRISALVTSAQVGAAYDGAHGVHLMLRDARTPVRPHGVILPEAWGGWTNLGMPLDSLLRVSIEKVGASDAATFDAAKSEGLDFLKRVAREQVGAASRGAEQVAVASRPGLGYTRMVNPPCCADCAILAGKFFRWNTGFQRHPGCDCYHVPIAGGEVPEGYVDDIELDQITDLSDAERRALDEGADIYQVINARRGAKGHLTTEGATGYGMAGKLKLGADRRQLTPMRRLTVDAIYAKGGSREAILKRLEENGYFLSMGRDKRTFEGFGQMGRGGTRVGAREAVLRAQMTGVRDPRSVYTMTAAERRKYDRQTRSAKKR